MGGKAQPRRVWGRPPGREVQRRFDRSLLDPGPNGENRRCRSEEGLATATPEDLLYEALIHEATAFGPAARRVDHMKHQYTSTAAGNMLESPSQQRCRDAKPFCEELQKEACSGENVSSWYGVPTDCPKSCGACAFAVKSSDCEDEHTAACYQEVMGSDTPLGKNLCITEAERMKRTCPFSCGFCRNREGIPSIEL